ncbi:MAG TPA: sigma-54-dependent Fis family transcriptional regulator, partial [Rhodospirillaceae bacterium]|nr:sigma-54-dependent Fis family transcriptional regulator [Rhodospirillaceae bacterium]
EDLYFRLNVVNLKLPALRERPSDILPLSQFFADKYAEANGVAKKKISKEAEEKLIAYNWRGNIRELENTMHRAILISIEDEIEADAIHLNEAMRSSEASAPATSAPDPSGVSSAGDQAAQGGDAMVGKTVADVEKNLILNTLDHCLGNRTQAAKILGISIRTLRNKLNQYQDEGMNIPASQS